MGGGYDVGLGFCPFLFSGDISLMFLMHWNAVVSVFWEQFLQVAIVHSVPAFGESFL